MKYICSTNSNHLFNNPTEDLFCPKCNPYEGILIAVEESELEAYFSTIDSKQKDNTHKVEKKSKWICSTDSTHTFNEPTEDKFCPKCSPLSGVLVETDGYMPSQKPLSTGGGGNIEHPVKKGISLNIFLLDASKSMFNSYLINGEQIEGAKALCQHVANSIFICSELRTKEEKKYVLLIAFDKGLKAIINFISVKEIISRFNSRNALQSYLFSEISKMQNGKNVQLALNTAYSFVQNFINGNINNIVPVVQSYFNIQTGDDILLPNINCFLYINNYSKIKNPFEKYEYENTVINFLTVVYLGKDENDFRMLKSISGACPIHDKRKIFNFDELFQTAQQNPVIFSHFWNYYEARKAFCNRCLCNSVWICSTDSTHTFNEPTEDRFCPKCPPLSGVLYEVNGDELNSNNQPQIQVSNLTTRTVWVCSEDKHIFFKPTKDLFCDKCEPDTSVLMEYELKKVK